MRIDAVIEIGHLFQTIHVSSCELGWLSLPPEDGVKKERNTTVHISSDKNECHYQNQNSTSCCDLSPTS